MRKRTFSRSFKKKKPVRWFSSDVTYMANHNVLTTSSLAGPQVHIMAMHQKAALQTPELVENIERHTIEAVRGQILVNGSSDANLNVHLGIRVVDLLPTGVPQAYDPQDPTESDEQWMWLHHVYVPIGSLGSVGLSTNTIDVRVKSKRVLRTDQALCLFVSVSNTFLDGTEQASGAVALYPYLRTLVSRPE